MKWDVKDWSFADSRDPHRKLTVGDELRLLKDYCLLGSTVRELGEKYGISPAGAAEVLEYWRELFFYRAYGGRGKPPRPECLGLGRPFREV